MQVCLKLFRLISTVNLNINLFTLKRFLVFKSLDDLHIIVLHNRELCNISFIKDKLSSLFNCCHEIVVIVVVAITIHFFGKQSCP